MVDYTPIAPNSAEPEVAVNAALAALAEAIDQAGGFPDGGEPGQILSLDDDGELIWIDPPEGGAGGLPEDGEPGQVLTKTADGAEWMTPSGGGGGGGGGAPAIVTVRRNTGFIWPIANDWNAVPYETIVDQDVSGVWSLAEPTKFFVPDGYSRIRFTGFFLFESNGGDKYIHLLDKNNQNVGASRPGVPTQSLWYVGVGRSGNQLVSRWLTVAPGDWFTFKVFTFSSNLYAGAENGYPFVQVELA